MCLPIALTDIQLTTSTLALLQGVCPERYAIQQARGFGGFGGFGQKLGENFSQSKDGRVATSTLQRNFRLCHFAGMQVNGCMMV